MSNRLAIVATAMFFGPIVLGMLLGLLSHVVDYYKSHRQDSRRNRL